MYKIGDEVWVASCLPVEKTIPCPDCLGQKFLTVIIGDGTQHTIDCAGCSQGYDPPKGYVSWIDRTPHAVKVTITRKEETLQGVEYGHSDNYRSKEAELFKTEPEALIRSAELQKEHEQESLAKIHRKDKNDHTWAWHVFWHRNNLKKAFKEVEYHTAKLEVAKSKAKEKG